MSLRDYLWLNRSRIKHTEFAKKVGISKNYLSNISNGKQMPSVSMAKRLEKATDNVVSWSDIMEFCYQMMQNSKKD